MECRSGCGACCIAISISSPIPGMGGGKPAGTRCFHLGPDCTCLIYRSRPEVCRNFRADPEYCSDSREKALENLGRLEKATCPGAAG
ncbi:MAG: YkgJ family cysteine cluster protein [Brevinematales bacterium]|jgi:Fe-S-cluster containining protein